MKQYFIIYDCNRIFKEDLRTAVDKLVEIDKSLVFEIIRAQDLDQPIYLIPINDNVSKL